MGLLRTNSVKESFEFKKLQFLTRLLERGYPKSFAEDILTEIKFSMRKTALQDKPKTSKKNYPFRHHFQSCYTKPKTLATYSGQLQSPANIQKSPNGCLSEGQISEKLSCESKNSFTLI